MMKDLLKDSPHQHPGTFNLQHRSRVPTQVLFSQRHLELGSANIILLEDNAIPFDLEVHETGQSLQSTPKYD